MEQELTPNKITALTSSEFFRLIDAARPAVAVFDCDGTLWGGDAGVGFMNWSMESGLLSRQACDWMNARYRAYLRGEVSELAICGEMVQVYRDLRETELRQAAHVYFDTMMHSHVFPEMHQLCHQLRQRGVIVWAVSSTNNWLIEDAMQHFGIPPERILATCVRIVNGLVTDELLDVPTDEGKAESLSRHDVKHPDAAFGNSIHDAAMLATAVHPFAVNPTTALVELATAKRWPIFQPSPAEPGPSHT